VPETARCPRCGGDFACGARDIDLPCACTRIALDAATLALLRTRYEGCLCLRCLADLASGAREGQSADDG
jgi:hypothetical protein